MIACQEKKEFTDQQENKEKLKSNNDVPAFRFKSPQIPKQKNVPKKPTSKPQTRPRRPQQSPKKTKNKDQTSPLPIFFKWYTN